MIVDCMKASTLQHHLRWVKSPSGPRETIRRPGYLGRLNCDADKLAKQFQKLMDDGVIRPLQEGFFTKSMEVGISVNWV
jgi:hypothetical protein